MDRSTYMYCSTSVFYWDGSIVWALNTQSSYFWIILFKLVRLLRFCHDSSQTVQMQRLASIWPKIPDPVKCGPKPELSSNILLGTGNKDSVVDPVF